MALTSAEHAVVLDAVREARQNHVGNGHDIRIARDLYHHRLERCICIYFLVLQNTPTLTMAGLVGLVLMASLLGLGSFVVGVLPLSFTFSSKTVARSASKLTNVLLRINIGLSLKLRNRAAAWHSAGRDHSRVSRTVVT